MGGQLRGNRVGGRERSAAKRRHIARPRPTTAKALALALASTLALAFALARVRYGR
jgi:hypothetical protein